MADKKLLNIFAKRLKNARIMNGLSMDDLCKKMPTSVSKMSISKYESGALIPNSTVLISLSKALAQPIDYFFRPFTVSIESVKFRKKSSLPIKKENALKESIADFAERYLTIEEICTLPCDFHRPDFKPVANERDAKECAMLLRKKWNLGEDGIVNVIAMLEEHNIKVLEINADEKFDGLSSMINGVHPIIVLNLNFSAERKRFTALHELGHLILSFMPQINAKNQELLCNAFANEMLIPEKVFKKAIGAHRAFIAYQELQGLQRQFGISPDALMYKAKNAGIISESRYKFFQIQKNRSRKLRENFEESLYMPEESFRFIQLVYSALSRDLLSISMAASLLKQSIETVRGNLSLL